MTIPESLRSVPVTNLLLTLREYRDRQELWEVTRRESLESMLEMAKIQSTGSSNRIEGIVTTERRLLEIVRNSSEPHNRAEEEIAGYRDVLCLIHEQHDYIPVTPGVILQLHRDLLAHTPLLFGGSWKDADNQIVNRNADGTTTVRFLPMPAILTPGAVGELCSTYNAAFHAQACDPALLAARFTLDFVSIHPFNDGNGRMSRLLTVLLLERAGYFMTRYVSLERMIEDSKDQYYDALAQSSVGWIDGTNDEAPFVRYLLGMMLASYRKLEQSLRDSGGKGRRPTAIDRVRSVFEHRLGKVTKGMALSECPDLSEVTVKRVLSRLAASGEIAKVDSGPKTGYVRTK